MELLEMKMLFCITLSVSGQTDAPGGGGMQEDENIIGVGNTDVRCYTCDNVQDNDECNGVNLGENGTLTKCTTERSNCFSIIKMNAAGDGYSTQKGCMDFDECYDKFYDVIYDPIVGGKCNRFSLLGHDNLPPDEECFYCCFSGEGRTLDSCNHAMGMMYLALPSPNNWDPAVDKWAGHEPVESTAAPDVTDGGEAVARPLATVIGINVFLLTALLD